MRMRQAGFTLIEVILVIVAGAALAALVTAIMGSTLTQGPDALQRQREDFRAEQALAQVTRDYVSLTNDGATRATALDTLKANADGGTYNQGADVAVVAAWVAYDAGGNEAVDASGANETLRVTATWAGGRAFSALYTRPRPDPTTQLVQF